MQQVKALPLPETKLEREARLSSALGVAGNSGIPSCMPSAAVPAPIEEDEDMHHAQDDLPDFDLGEDEANLAVRPRPLLPELRVCLPCVSASCACVPPVRACHVCRVVDATPLRLRALSVAPLRACSLLLGP